MGLIKDLQNHMDITGRLKMVGMGSLVSEGGEENGEEKCSGINSLYKFNNILRF